MLARRELLLGAAASAVMPLGASAGPRSLRTIASAKGITFGSMIVTNELADPAYAALIVEQCAIVTPGVEAKWPHVQPSEGQFDFSQLDLIVDFARRNALAIHMHNLIWANGMPPWLLLALRERRGEAVMRKHITTVAGRYAGLVESWDVVNEPIDSRWPHDSRGILTIPWWHALGPSFIADALFLAKEADPNALLLINDAGFEYETQASEWKRIKYIEFIESLKKQNTPLHGIGLESHLITHENISEISYRKFLSTLAGMGLKIYVTELDVNDEKLPSDISVRDRSVAECTRKYLDVTLDERAVGCVMTWGLSDSDSYFNAGSKPSRSDKLKSRPLPYDEHLVKKPMWDALAAAFASAPARS